MKNLPSVIINLIDTPNGVATVGTDGSSGLIVSGIAVSGKFALGDVLGPFYSLSDAEAMGIDATYDTTNTTVAHKQIADFYAEAGTGAELYVMVVASTVTMTQMLQHDGNYAPVLISTSNGKIRMLAVSRTPENGYTPTYTNQFDAEIWAAITEAKLLRADQFSKGIPISIIVEGRDFQGVVSSTEDMSDPTTANAEFVSLMIGQDVAYSTGASHFAQKYAAVGDLLGRLSGIQVQRNAGRVLDGARSNIAIPGLSNGLPLRSGTTVNFTDTQLNTLNDHRYIFFRNLQGQSGAFYSNDWCACPETANYNRISRCRPVDKAIRITNALYIQNLLDDIELDAATGKMNAAVIKSFQSSVEREITEQMMTPPSGGVKEISGVQAIADPQQNVQVNGKVNVKLNIVPKGMTDAIEVDIDYVTSLN